MNSKRSEKIFVGLATIFYFGLFWLTSMLISFEASVLIALAMIKAEVLPISAIKDYVDSKLKKDETISR